MAHAIDEIGPVLTHEIARAFAGPKVDDALLALLGLQHPVEPRPAFGPDLVGELALKLDLGLRPKFQRDQLARLVPYAVGDIVSGNIQNAAVVEDAPGEDMRMRMARVVMIDGDPVEPCVEVLFDLPHQVADEAAQIGHLNGIFGGDDEAELVAVLPTTLDEGLAVGFVLQSRIGPAFLAITGDPIAFEIAQKGIGCLADGAAHLRAAGSALGPELDDLRLYYHAAGAEAADRIPLPAAAIAK
jgi:hypothetical protein